MTLSSTDARHRVRILIASAAVDALIVALFVAIGRRNHHESTSLGGYVSTVAPFAIALAATWTIGRVWRAPVSARAGIEVWLGTVSAGMVLRKFAFGDGTATAFVIVATVFLGTLLNGWRTLARFRSDS